MVGVRRNDEGVLSLDVRGTAFDSSLDGEYVVVAGYRALTLVLVSSPSTAWLRQRTNRHIVKKVKLHPTRNIFACVAGQNIDVYELSKDSMVQKHFPVSFSAHPRKILDFDWSYHNENLMVCCADHDTVTFWDLRDTCKPCLELDLVFGASQAKFAPNLGNILLSTHGSDMRLWDLRNPLHPVNQFTSHEARIQCLQWHPQEPNTFASSAIDGLLKVWDLMDQKHEPNVTSIGSVNCWRMMFSVQI